MDNKNKFLSGHHLIDLFPNRFSFYLWKKNIKNHIKNLDDITLTALFNLFSFIVISDVSIKNLITMFISHIYMHNKPIIKTIYYAINITFTKAELFAIHCSINQFVQVKKIIIIADSLHIVKSIFDLLMHSY